MRYLISLILLSNSLYLMAQDKLQWALEPVYSYAREFKGELAYVKKDNKWIYINKVGIQVKGAERKKYDYGKYSGEFRTPADDQLRKVTRSGKWGYKDRKGNFVIDPQFQFANDFSEGAAAVKKDGKWGYIDTQGNWLFEPVFSDARDFKEGLAAAKIDDDWGFVSLKNSSDIPAASNQKPQLQASNIKAATIKEYVENKINAWQKKGEFEKTADYRQRVTEQNFRKQIDIYTQEALAHFGSQQVNLNQREIIKYDADQEVFLAKVSGQDIVLKVPIDAAPDFKLNFFLAKFQNPRYGYNEEKIFLTYLEAVWREKTYVFDGQQQYIASRSQEEPMFDFNDYNMSGSDMPETIVLAEPVEVDDNLPETKMENPDAIAVIIGNSRYNKTKDVAFALNDSRMIRKYLIEVMGYREGNILYYENASKANFEEIFGNFANAKGRLYNTVRPEVSDVFIYYSGHGAPGLNSGKGYFVPVESDPQYIEQSGFDLELFYKNLSQIPAKSMTVVLDACFSGENLFENISPIRIRIQNRGLIPNGTILSSSADDQVSGWYPEKQHGLFTYFFLKAIHEGNADADQNGELSLQEIYDFISDNAYGIPYYARRLHGITQVPQLSGEGESILIRYK